MHRFQKNRWWTLILTLTLCLVSFAGPRLVHADDPQVVGDPGGIQGTQGGDPDVPDHPGKNQGLGHGAMRPSTNVYRLQLSAGDGSWNGSVMMWRLRVAAWSLRIFFVRF